MKFIKFAMFAALAIGAVSIVACKHHHGGGYYGGGYYGGGYTDPYYDAWYDVYGYYCGSTPSAGCNFYADGVKIIDIEDPYYSQSNILYYDYWTFYDSYGYYASFTGYAWLSPTGILYDEYGWALNESGEDRGLDIIEDAAKLADAKMKQAGASFATKFALSESTGIEVAKTLQDWANLGKKHARTEKDISEFSKRLYGVSFDKAVTALADAQAGDLSKIKEVNANIADHWGTTPETSSAILKSFYKNYLNEIGL